MPESTRQLAAIMFTDIVGYTSLMGQDSDKALELIRVSKEIQKPLVEKHNGKWLKEMGDGILASFNSALEAVNCSIEIQKGARGDLDAKLRIGIHLGDITIEDEDVYGDGVNVASRLESIADPGGIYISESIEQSIQGISNVQAKYLGEVKLKNVAYGVRTYAIQGEGLPEPDGSKVEKMAKPNKMKWIFIGFGFIVILWLGYLIYQNQFKQRDVTSVIEETEIDKSIAVLPFVNMSSDEEQEYFSDGLTEEIIMHLANIDELSVISRTSVFQYKDRLKDITTIGKELGVSYILEGSVRRDQNTIRITVQLINATTDKHIWADNYDRDLDKILEIQSEVARKVANVLDIKLTTPEIQRINRKSTDNYSAYDYYLKAVQEDKKWTVNGAYKALEFLDSAIQLDPEFSEAYSLYAWQYINLASFSNLETQIALKKALPAIQRAIELDSLSSDAYLVYGAVNHFLEWDFEKANKNYEKSMELNSWGEAPIFQCICAYVEFLLTNNEITETWALFEKINKIDPGFFMVFEYKSILYLLNNEPDKALDILIQIDSYSTTEKWTSYANYGNIYYMAEEFDSATIYMEKALELRQNRDPYILAWLSLSYYKVGKIQDSQLILDELLLRQANKEFGLNVPIAMIYNVMGNENLALEWLGKAYDARETYLLWIKIIHFQNLLDNPKYMELISKIGFEIT